MNLQKDYWAHSANGDGKRHGLVEHLQGTAKLCREFCDAFGAGELGYWLGLWHDIGKFNPAWQEYLLEAEANPRITGRGPEHKVAGTILAEKHFGLLSLATHGHHGGLTTRSAVANKVTDAQLARAAQDAIARARNSIANLEPGAHVTPPPIASTAGEMFVRMVFSSLVDADSLDTEAHTNPSNSQARGGAEASASALSSIIERSQREMGARAADTTVNRVRREIYEACLDRAADQPGLFRLTVPTGGGKTRSGMAFALRHAALHGLHRVVVALPFITITDQTAAVYRDIFGEANVLEHHSGTEVPDDDVFTEAAVRARLATENWDAPIVVTTTVRLFESMFSNRRSDCRRLHRLAKSIVILDEAQALPAHLLEPILDGLREFCQRYGSTVVLSTATQPAFSVLKPFRDLPATEIVPEPRRYFESLKRVEYDWRLGSQLTWGEVAAVVRAEPRILTVVNTRRDAVALLDELDDPEALHLSTNLYGAHRREVLLEVRRRLKGGESCRLVSTQVVEAGVDLDFPVVMRAVGPFDSIVQAAGRANREGLGSGRVIVFDPADGHLPPGDYRARTAATLALYKAGRLDPDDPGAVDAYFRRVYDDVPTDRERIQRLRAAYKYPEVAAAFQMVDDDTVPAVVARHGSTEQRRSVRGWLDALQAGTDRPRVLMRRLQPYAVALRRSEFARYKDAGLIAEVVPGLGEWCGDYDPVRGVVPRHPLDGL